MTIIDVRTRGEFVGGHVAGSVNIPVQEIQNHLEEIKNMQQPITLCCASGGRSAMATAWLKSQGVACQDGGSWMDVNYEMSRK